MTGSAKAGSYAAKQRRKYRHAEWSEQIRLTQLLTQYLPDNVFWSALSNAPRSALAGYLAKIKGPAGRSCGHHGGTRRASDFS